jgi:hypothetical protein
MIFGTCDWRDCEADAIRPLGYCSHQHERYGLLEAVAILDGRSFDPVVIGDAPEQTPEEMQALIDELRTESDDE